MIYGRRAVALFVRRHHSRIGRVVPFFRRRSLDLSLHHPSPPLSCSAKPGPAGRRQKKAFGQGGGADGTAGGNASTGDGVILDDCRGRDTCARDGILRTVAAADLREIRSAVSRGKAHTVRVHFTFRSHTFAAALLSSTSICVIEYAPSDCFY